MTGLEAGAVAVGGQVGKYWHRRTSYSRVGWDYKSRDAAANFQGARSRMVGLAAVRKPVAAEGEASSQHQSSRKARCSKAVVEECYREVVTVWPDTLDRLVQVPMKAVEELIAEVEVPCTAVAGARIENIEMIVMVGMTGLGEKRLMMREVKDS